MIRFKLPPLSETPQPDPDRRWPAGFLMFPPTRSDVAIMVTLAVGLPIALGTAVLLACIGITPSELQPVLWSWLWGMA